jgi:hypothetical protein
MKFQLCIVAAAALLAGEAFGKKVGRGLRPKVRVRLYHVFAVVLLHSKVLWLTELFCMLAPYISNRQHRVVLFKLIANSQVRVSSTRSRRFSSLCQK